MEQKTFIVTGLARGGTSVVAALIHKFGVEMIREQYNFDDLDTLHSLISDKRYEEFLERQNTKHDIWGFKYPGIFGKKFNRIMPRLRNPQVIVVFRDPLAVAMHGKNPPDGNTVKRKVERLKEFSDIYMNKEYSIFGISYEKLLVKKERTIKELAEFCEVKLDKKTLKECIDFIVPEDKYKKMKEEYGS